MSIWTDWSSRVFSSPAGSRRLGRQKNAGAKRRSARRRAGFESLENRRVFAVTANVALGVLNISIDAGDAVAITASGADVKINGVDPLSGVELASAIVQINLTTTGNFANTIDLTGITQGDFTTLALISLDAGDGSDIYQLDQSGLLAIAVVNVADTGASGSDSLFLTTTAAGPETIGVSSTSVSRSTGATVGYSGLESLQVDGSAAGDTITATSTETATATTINTGGGTDVFTAIDLTTIGGAGLTINAGGNGESLTLEVTTVGTVDVSSTAVQRSGNGVVNYTGLMNLVVNGTAGIDTFNVLSTAALVLTQINALGDTDLFGIIDLSTLGGALDINAGGNTEALVLNIAVSGSTTTLTDTFVQRMGNAPINYTGFATLDLNGTAGTDSLTVSSTAAGTETTINLGAGADAFLTPIGLNTIGLAGLNLTTDGGESLTLNVGVAGIVAVNNAFVQRTGNGEVNYTGIATLLINGTAGVDTFNIASTAAGTATTVNAMGGMDVFGDINLSSIGLAGLSLDSGPNGEALVLKVTTAGTVSVSATSVTRSGNGAVGYLGFATLQIDGTAGADTFNVASTANLTTTTINAGGALDIFGAISLTSIGTNGLTINAGGNSESITFNTTVTGIVDVVSTHVQRTGNGIVNYSGFGTLLVNGTAGADTFNVISTAVGTVTTIAAAGGLDIFTAINLPDIGAAGLTLNAGGDNELLTLETAVAGTVDVTSTAVQRSTNGLVNYSNFATLIVNGTAAADTFNVASTAAGTATTINAAGGLDIFGNINLTTIGAADLTINAGSNGEALTLNTSMTGTVDITSVDVTRSGNGSVNYTGLAILVVNGTAGGDTFNVISTAGATATTINAVGGTDSLGNIDLTMIGATGLTINAGANSESLTLNTAIVGAVTITSTTVTRSGNGTLTYSGLGSLIVNGTAGADTFTVTSTDVGTATTINANGATDTFTAIGLDTIGTAGLTLNAGGNSEALTLNVGTAGVVAVTSSTVLRTGNGLVTYNGLATLLITGTAGIDTFNVASTAAGTATTINAGGSLDVFGAIDLTTIGAAGLTINVGSNSESLTLNTTVAGTVNITSTFVQRIGNGQVSYSGLTTLIVNGTGSGDTFDIDSTAAGVATTVNAAAGLDTFTDIDLTSIAAAGLTISAGGNGESLVLKTTVTGIVDVSNVLVQRNGNGPVNYSGLTSLQIDGTAGVDTFNVASTAIGTATTINAAGGTDIFGNIDLTTIAVAGLTINAGGNSESLTLNTTTTGTVDVSSTAVKRMGNGPVNYTGLTTLNINGTAGADTFNVASTVAGTATTINAAGGTDTFGAIGLTTISAAGLTINAGGNGETLVLNTVTTGIVTLTSTTVQRSGNGIVNYSGLTTLDLNGTAGADTFTVLSTAGATLTTINANGGTDVFSPIDLTTIGAAGLILNAGGNNESLVLNVSSTGIVDIAAFTVQRSGNGQITYNNFATLEINGTAGADTFNVASTHNNTDTTINAGGGIDVFGNIALTTIGTAGLTINAGGDNEALTLNTTTTGTVDISATAVQRSGNGPLNYFGLATLIINGTTGSDTFDVASTEASTDTTINALGGTDIFDDIDLTTIGTAGLTINAGGNGESLTLNTTVTGTVDISSATVKRMGNGPVNYSGLDALEINGTTGADTFNVASTHASTETTINAGDDLDVFAAIDLTTMGTAGLIINACADGELLTLNTTVTGTVNVSSTTVQRVGNGPIDYTGLATLIINGTAGADTFDVDSTAAATATTINAFGGTDIFDDIDLTTMGTAGLMINAGGNGELLTLETMTAGTVTLTDSLVQRSGNGPVNYTGLANLVLNGTAGVDLFNILSTNATTAYTLNSGTSNDVITLGNAGTLDGILGAMILHGNGHDASPTSSLTAGPTTNTLSVGDTLHFDDIALGVGAVYAFTTNTFLRTGTALVTFDTFETFLLDAGSMNDTIDVVSTLANTSLTVNGNGSADTITLLTNGGNTNVLLDGGASDDTINVQSVAATSVVVVNGGAGDDTVNVSSNAPANSGTLDAIAGAFAVDTGAGSDKLIISDRGQSGLHNSNVEVRNNRVRGFAGATNNVDIHYDFDDSLELTLIGANGRSDKFMVQLPSKDGLTMRFDGRGGTKDCVHINGTSGKNVVRVGTFASARPYRLQNIECLQMFGRGGNDILENHTAVSSLIDGGDGNDFLVGGSTVDVIFGGDGVDELIGNAGGDYLFGDHEFNNRNPRVKHAVDNDKMTGNTGVDTIVAVKTDIVSAGGNVGDTIIGSSKGLTSVDWLRARFLTSSGKNIQNAINAALAQSCTK
jgi:hypothetical protein